MQLPTSTKCLFPRAQQRPSSYTCNGPVSTETALRAECQPSIPGSGKELQRRLGLGPFQSPFKWVPGALSLGQSVGAAKLGTYLSSRTEVKHALRFKERCSRDRSEGLYLTFINEIGRANCPLTSKSQIQYHNIPCGICGGQSGTRTDTSPFTAASPCPIIPTLNSIHSFITGHS